MNSLGHKPHNHSCRGCAKLIHFKDLRTIELIRSEYLKDNTTWFLGFSGGKDSTALLKLVIEALRGLKKTHKKINIIYCDTGVDIPTISNQVNQTLQKLKQESNYKKWPLEIHLAIPKVEDQFFVRVIGRGYPTPTSKFRWCTDKLRINPVKSITEKIIPKGEKAVLLLGVRENESQSRNKILSRHKIKQAYYKQTGNPSLKIFAPIFDYSLKDVWGTVLSEIGPESIDGDEVSRIYKDASGECPTVRDPNSPPCGKGRFGCWVCTVVSKDNSMINMTKEKYLELKPLLEFRNWIALFRDNLDYRLKFRRNGQVGLGPFSLEGRVKILLELNEANRKVNFELISLKEIFEIFYEWSKDELLTELNLEKRVLELLSSDEELKLLWIKFRANDSILFY